MNPRHLVGILIFLGACLIGVGVYLIFKTPELTPQAIQVSPTNVVSNSKTPAETPLPALVAKRTVPSGPMMKGPGIPQPYYKNPSNSYEVGVAYKNIDAPRVYVYDGRFLRPVPDEPTFLRFYGCRPSPQIIDCAPIYEMPNVSKPIGKEIE